MSTDHDLGTILPGLEALYRDLHRHPELAFQETRTAATAARRMRALGFDVTEKVGVTGVVAVLRNGAGPTVLLRADMDALPIREETGLPWASRERSTDERGLDSPVMHACGHDVHVTALIGACELLTRRRDAWRGTVVAVFQPGEESGLGARRMLEDGLLERFPEPDILLGQHVSPAPHGTVAHCPGVLLGATDVLTVRLFGRGGHGSRPESAVDPVVMAASLVLRLQTVVSREVSPRESAVVTVGTLSAGTTPGAIPAEAELSVNIRSFAPAVRAKVMAAVERRIQAEAVAAGAPREPEIVPLYRLPVTANHPASTERVIAAHAAEFGPRAVHRTGPQSASEDFGLLAEAAARPSVYWFIGGTAPAVFARAVVAGTVERDVPHNHAPTFAPVPRPTLATGVRALATAALVWLGPGTTEPGVP
ncbi:amidohydrolase [Planobispora rosea]|uniref:amidohydrolase n=1 Tax=Planobispora rosea TaxID=35762 RepID=UPI000A9DEB62|nr:amidohydrolase [Planobispora rosea]